MEPIAPKLGLALSFLFFVSIISWGEMGSPHHSHHQGPNITKSDLKKMIRDLTPSYQFVYEYQARIVTGIPQLAGIYSGIQITSSLVFTTTDTPSHLVYMQMRDVWIGKVNDNIPDIRKEELPFTPLFNDVYRNELCKPIRFSYRSLEVKSFESDDSEPEWSLNIKRGILALLNDKFLATTATNATLLEILLKSHNKITGFEDGIGGDCETTYFIDPFIARLNLTKIRNLTNCKGSPCTSNHHQSNGKSEEDNLHLHKNKESERSSFTVTKMNVTFNNEFSPFIINAIVNEGHILYPVHNQEIAVFTHQSMKLVKYAKVSSKDLLVDSASFQETESQIWRENSCCYYEPNGHEVAGIPSPSSLSTHEIHEIARQTKEAFFQLGLSIAVGRSAFAQNVSELTLKTIDGMTLLPEKELETMLIGDENPVDQSQEPRKLQLSQILRKLFVDALGLVGTDAAASCALNLIKTRRFKDWEAREVLQAIPNTIRSPTKETVKGYMTLCQVPGGISGGELRSPACLAFAKMAAKRCHSILVNRSSNKNDVSNETTTNTALCSTPEVEQYENAISGWFKFANSLEDMLVYTETMAAFGMARELMLLLDPNADICKQLPTKIRTKDECDFMHIGAINALRHLTPDNFQKFQPVLEDVFFDPKKSTSVRVASFERIIQNPDDISMAFLHRILVETRKDFDSRLAAHVRSSLETLEKTYRQYSATKANRVRRLLERFPRPRSGSNEVDWNFAWNIPTANGNALSVTLKTMTGKMGRFPEYGQLTIQHGTGGSNKILVTCNVLSRGIRNIGDLLHSGGHVNNSKESSQSPIREEAIDQLPITNRDGNEPKLSMWWTLFDQDETRTLVSERALGKAKENFSRWATQMLNKIERKRTTHYVKLMLPTRKSTCLMTPVGIPVVFSHRTPFLISLTLENAQIDVKTINDNNKKHHSSMNVETKVKLWLHWSSIHDASIIDSPDEMTYRAIHRNLYQLRLPVAVRFNSGTNRGVRFAAEPELPNKMFYHENVAATVIEDLPFSSSGKEFPQKDAYEIRTLPRPITFAKNVGKGAYGMELQFRSWFEENNSAFVNFPRWINLKNMASIKLNEMAVSHLVKEIFYPSLKYRRMEITAEKADKKSSYGMEVSFNHKRSIVTEHPKFPNYRNPNSFSEKIKVPVDGKEVVNHRKDKLMGRILASGREYKRGPLIDYEKESNSIPPLDVTVWNITFSTLWTKGVCWNANITYVHDLNLTTYAMGVDVHLTPAPKVNQQYSGLGYFVFDYVPNELSWEAGKSHIPVAASGDFALRKQKMSEDIHAIWLDSKEQMAISTPRTRAATFIASTDGQKTRNTIHGRNRAQCISDEREGKALSEACLLDLIHHAVLNRMEFRLEHPMFIEQLPWLNVLLKTQWYRYIKNIAPKTSNNATSKLIKINAFYKMDDTSATSSLVNIRIEEPQEIISFQNVYSPIVRPLSGFLSNWNRFPRKSSQEYMPYCAVMGRFIRTFDNVTYSYPKHNCQYLLAKDCSSENRFSLTVTGQRSGSSMQKKLKLRVANHTIELSPPSTPRSNDIIVSIDDRKVPVTYPEPKILCAKDSLCIIIRVVDDARPIITVEIEEEDMKIQYDGQHIKIEASNLWHKGRLCGLCGNNDHESAMEFEGPAMCIYESEAEFADSYALNPSECGIDRVPKGKVTCPEPQVIPNKDNPEASQDDPKCLAARTVYIEKGPNVCFSRKPIRACLNCKTADYVSVPVEFHCMPAQLPFTKHLKRLSKTQVLYNFVDKQVDLTEPYLMPVICESIQ